MDIIITIPTFIYGNLHSQHIYLKKDNIEKRIEQLTKGENLFTIIPELKKEQFNKYRFQKGWFVRQKKAIINGEELFSKNNKEIGKILIPYYKITTREEFTKKLNKQINNFEEEIYTKLLTNYPHTKQFFHSSIYSYEPFNSEEMLILTKNQLL